MLNTYFVIITVIIIWAPTMELIIQDQGHTLNLTQHDSKVLELICNGQSLLDCPVFKLEIGVQNSTTSQEVPLVALTFDNKIFNVSLDPLARVKGQVVRKDPSKCSLQVTQPLRFGVYRCSIYTDRSSNISFQVTVDERHKESNNGSFTVKVLPAIVVKATWVQNLTSELDEVSLTQFTVGEAEKPVGQTVLYVNNTAKNSFESELVFLSSFSQPVHAGQEKKFEVSLYLRSDTNSKNTNYSVSVSSSSEGLRRISGLKEITCEIQSDQVRSYFVELVCVSVVLFCTCALCITFVVLYIRTCNILDSTQTSPTIPDSTQTSPTIPDSTQTSPTIPDSTQTSPTIPDSTQTSPTIPDSTQTSPTIPDSTQTSPTIPDSTQTSPTIPDSTQTSPNIPDSTQTSPTIPDSTQTSPTIPDSTQTSPNIPDSTQTSPTIPDSTQTSPNIPDSTQTSPTIPDSTQTSPNIPDSTQTSPNLSESTQSDSVEFVRFLVTSTHKFESSQPENPRASLTPSTRNRRKRNKHHRTKDISGASADTDLLAVRVNPNSDDESVELMSWKEVMDGLNTDKSDSDSSVTLHETNRPARK